MTAALLEPARAPLRDRRDRERELALPAALERLTRPGSRAAAQSKKQPPGLAPPPEAGLSSPIVAELNGDSNARLGTPVRMTMASAGHQVLGEVQASTHVHTRQSVADLKHKHPEFRHNIEGRAADLEARRIPCGPFKGPGRTARNQLPPLEPQAGRYRWKSHPSGL